MPSQTRAGSGPYTASSGHRCPFPRAPLGSTLTAVLSRALPVLAVGLAWALAACGKGQTPAAPLAPAPPTPRPVVKAPATRPVIDRNSDAVLVVSERDLLTILEHEGLDLGSMV